MLSTEQRLELTGLALFALALVLALAMLPAGVIGLAEEGNLVGSLGRALSSGARTVFGGGAYLLPVGAAIGGAFGFGWLDRERALRLGALAVGLLILLPVAQALGALASTGTPFPAWSAAPGGLVGAAVASGLVALLGVIGSTVVVVFVVLSLFVATLGWNPARPLARGAAATATRAAEGLRGGWAAVRERWQARRARGTPAPSPWAAIEADEAAGPSPLEEAAAETSGSPARAEASPSDDDAASEAPGPVSRAGRIAYKPPLDLLTPQPPRDASLSEAELDRLGQVLVDTLQTFRVESSISGRTTGPVVTQYEVVPAPGVKVARIANLDADLALALRAPSVRIVAPIPGKGAVGVEVPNPAPEVVYLRDILRTRAFARGRAALPLALGRDLEGTPYVADLARMPHLLIAGATGSGKSVCVNTLITSLVYRHGPDSLRLLLIDPKMVELSMYAELPHLRHPVVTDPKDAAFVLKWAVYEMERRYQLLSENGARSIAEFNRRLDEGQVLRRVEPEGPEGDPERWFYKDGPLPYVVVVVDELADLMMSVQSEIERPLAQLTQKARAIGIHLVVATQRPSVNVITGLIKANFPCRIAFRVSSKVDSRTIIDQNGADALLGNGDMLFLPPGQSDPVRIQGAYMPTEDTDRLVNWYRELTREDAAAEEEDILEVVRAREQEEAAEEINEALMEERDPLFRAAAEVCVQYEQGSTSLLQRRLRVGYGRAARIVDQLHAAGVLGPPDGSKPRDVLVGLEAVERICRESRGSAAAEPSIEA
ncbi:MAG TPA: DNA translocase FtsK 4TM domain-containing protein [Longimicrobiales bacterium]|nr:DNA translocase FtsK 4TM domain-containing protein [Longimicrobiales bacterium]